MPNPKAEAARDLFLDKIKRGKMDVSTVTILLAAAERGVPKKLAAPMARITRQTLHTWLTRTDEPYVSFATEWRAAFGRAGASLIDSVAATDPKYLLGAVHRIKPLTEAKIETKDTTEDLTRLPEAELDARLLELGYARIKETDDGKKTKERDRNAGTRSPKAGRADADD